MNLERMILPLTTIVVTCLLPACARNPPRSNLTSADTIYRPGQYRVFTGSGSPATLAAIVRAMEAHQVVFVGETHDDPTGHMLELELLKRAAQSYGSRSAAAGEPRPIALSLEFFERDVQQSLDDYLAGRVPEASFRAASRPWPRYQSDYRPLIEFSKTHKVSVIAGNAPRRYVTMVTRNGRASLDTLDAQDRQYLAPLPYGKPSPAYRDKWIAMISEVIEQEGMKCGVPVEHADAPPGSHQNMGNQLDSQVLWDATMAHSIARFLENQPAALVLHMVGSGHVERGTGTPEQLQAYAPGVRPMIVAIRPVAKIDVFQPAPAGQWGDFVIQTDKARTLEEIECRQFRAQRDRKP
jgi:uncharacterized iron-regulated protein